jgi:hypothetical protein
MLAAQPGSDAASVEGAWDSLALSLYLKVSRIRFHRRAGGIIPTPSGSASLASPNDALTRTAVELRSHPAMNQ